MENDPKLSAVLAGRTIAGTGNSNDRMTIQFTDHSKLTVRTTGSTNSASTGGTVQSVSRDAKTLELKFEGGALPIPLADPADIAVHDASGAQEYKG